MSGNSKLRRLGQVAVHLLSDSPQICAYWQRLFTGPPDHLSGDAPVEPISLTLQLADALTPPATSNRVYRDSQGILDVYREPAGAFALHFLQGALVSLQPDDHVSANGVVTSGIFEHDQLEDVTYVSLAPLLRRRGRYLVHAAAVSAPEGAILFVGPTHSGKTTTGLALILAGWKHLASDVVILAQSERGIVAYPTPGFVNVRPRTFELLPDLRQLRAGNEAEQSAALGGYLQLETNQWSTPAPVTAICFPQVSAESRSRLEPLDGSLALAQLMEESIDRWDTAALLEHIEFLTDLGRQASHHRLLLGPDVGELSERLQDAL